MFRVNSLMFAVSCQVGVAFVADSATRDRNTLRVSRPAARPYVRTHHLNSSLRVFHVLKDNAPLECMNSWDIFLAETCQVLFSI